MFKEELRKNGVVVGTVEYGYDDNGNTKTRTKKDAASNVVETVTYEWNQDHRLIGVQNSNGDAISYEYDADGVRVSKTVNGVKTEYLVDKNRDYAQVLDESVNNVLAASYVYGLDLISQSRENDDSFYLVDGLGSTRGLTDGGGNVTDTYTYDAFGNAIASTGNVENDYLFAGEQYDEDLDQYYLRQRYYNPSLGRFTRQDTYEGSLEDPMSLHKYLYAYTNPVNFIDPSGLSTMIGELNLVMATIGYLAAIPWLSLGVSALELATVASLAGFLAYYGIYVPYFASQRGHQGNQADTGILQEARGLIGEVGSNGEIIKTIEEALNELMRQAKKNKDNAKIKRIEKTQKAVKGRNKDKRKEY